MTRMILAENFLANGGDWFNNFMAGGPPPPGTPTPSAPTFIPPAGWRPPTRGSITPPSGTTTPPSGSGIFTPQPMPSFPPKNPFTSLLNPPGSGTGSGIFTPQPMPSFPPKTTPPAPTTGTGEVKIGATWQRPPGFIPYNPPGQSIILPSKLTPTSPTRDVSNLPAALQNIIRSNPQSGGIKQPPNKFVPSLTEVRNTERINQPQKENNMNLILIAAAAIGAFFYFKK